MKLRVQLAPDARAQLAEIGRWWRRNRPANPGLFRQEVKAALALIGERPEAGPEANEVGVDVRKVLLPRTQYYIYYILFYTRRIARVVAFSHTSRGRRPRVL